MSLEAKIEALTAEMSRNNDLLEAIVKGKAGAGSTETTEKAKPGRKPRTKADDSGDGDGDSGDGDAVDTAKLKKTLELAKGWLKEFAENEEDPENEARSDKLAAALEKLGVEKLSAITTEDRRARADKWIKARIEEGRITEEPAPKDKAKKGGDDDI